MNTTLELKTTGLRATTSRLRILKVFQTSEMRHLSAEDVYKRLLHENFDIGLATVYRVLIQFEQAGLIKRSSFGIENGKAIFELDAGEHHDHLVCLDCGRVEEFFDAVIEQRQKAVAQQHGFELRRHTLVLHAHCTNEPCVHRAEANASGGASADTPANDNT